MQPISISGVNLDVEMANTSQEHATGLQNRKSLPTNRGMLFCYSKAQPLSFWMKDTHIPLSIAFINSMGKIVDIKDMKPGSMQAIKSPCPCKWALESNKGWFKNNGINIGDTVDYCADKAKKILIRVVRK